MAESKEIASTPIILSQFTQALIGSIKSIKPKLIPDDLSKITVSPTVSLFALVYERVRNAVEYREDHLIRRAAIERIIKRRIMLNPEGKNEAENVLRELLWARYFPNGSLGGHDQIVLQEIIDKYLYLRKLLISGRNGNQRQYQWEFLVHMLTCEIEETLSPEDSTRYANFTFFIYQVLRNKIKIQGLSADQKDAYFLCALERSFRKNDKPYQRYHLFTTFYKPIHDYTEVELREFASKMPAIMRKIDDTITSTYVESLVRYTRKQLPPFLVLYSFVRTKFKTLESILTNRQQLWTEVDLTCREKYQQLSSRMRVLSIRSFIYIFLTKMVFALLLEFPLSKWVYGAVNYESIAINTLFPPILMLLIISFFKVPGEDNTRNIYNRLVDIIDADKSFETTIAYMPKKGREKKPILIFGFTIFYSLTFLVTFYLIYQGLKMLSFNLVSIGIFVFFISLVTFFSYRVKQIVNEYRLSEKSGLFSPVIDFFFMPILSIGKFLSGGLAKLNFFIFIFDFLIEAPFKLIFEVVEEWISFVRKRKEEII